MTYDFMCNYRFTKDDLSDWNGEILIMESDDDNSVDETARKELKGLYPKACIYTFHQAGHARFSARPTNS